MALALTIEQYLDSHHIPYEVVNHSRTPNSLKAAAAADIDASRLAKGILLEDDAGYVMAVLPASRHLKLNKLRHEVGRHDLHMATENEIGQLFKDCDTGAVPAIGSAYGLLTVWDDSLSQQPDLYFEGGDHERLVHVKTRDFMSLLEHSAHCEFSAPV